MQMFFLNSLALPDVAAVRKTGRRGCRRTLHSTAQCRCSPWWVSVCGDGLARDTERLQKLPIIWLQIWRLTCDGLSFRLLLFPPSVSLFFPLIPLLLHVVDKYTRETVTQRKSIRLVSWQKPSYIFDFASSFILSMGVVLGSRDTMGGTAIKRLLLGVEERIL